jgi:hypothetical protein
MVHLQKRRIAYHIGTDGNVSRILIDTGSRLTDTAVGNEGKGSTGGVTLIDSVVHAISDMKRSCTSRRGDGEGR